MNLFSIAAGYEALINREELDRADMMALDEMYTDLEDACIERAKYIKNLEAELTAVKDAIKEMTDRKKSLERKIDFNKEWLGGIMQDTKIDKITKCPYFKISLAKSPVSVVCNEEEVPEQYWRVKEVKTLDKVAIKQAIESGEAVDGAQLESHYYVKIK